MSIYFTPTHASVTIVHDSGVTKETSANDMAMTILNMETNEQEMLKAFARGIIECIGGNCKTLQEF